MSRSSKKRRRRRAKGYQNRNGCQVKVGTRVCWKEAGKWEAKPVRGFTVVGGVPHCTFVHAPARPVADVFISKRQ